MSNSLNSILDESKKELETSLLLFRTYFFLKDKNGCNEG
jgi:hypothetical protein